MSHFLHLNKPILRYTKMFYLNWHLYFNNRQEKEAIELGTENVSELREEVFSWEHHKAEGVDAVLKGRRQD